MISSAALAAPGSSSFEFMLIGPGSRAAAMGEAFTAVSGDAGAPYFNPASAGVMSGTELSLMHVSYLKDVTLEHLSILTQAGKFRYGVGMYYGSTSNIERRSDTPSQNPLGTFDEHNFVAAFNWAVPVSGRVSVGSAIKWAYQKLDIESASALALDFGGFYALSPKVTLGSSIRNLGTKPKFINESFDLPREFRLGGSYRTNSESSPNGFIFAADYVLTNWGNKSSKLNFGGEYSYANVVSLRLGYSAGYDTRSVSLGGGLSYNNYFFDYAFVPAKHNLRDTHRLTLRIKI
jgi:hypothetical protein